MHDFLNICTLFSNAFILVVYITLTESPSNGLICTSLDFNLERGYLRMLGAVLIGISVATTIATRDKETDDLESQRVQMIHKAGHAGMARDQMVFCTSLGNVFLIVWATLFFHAGEKTITTLMVVGVLLVHAYTFYAWIHAKADFCLNILQILNVACVGVFTYIFLLVNADCKM